MRLASRARAEFNFDLRPHEVGFLEQRLVTNVKPVSFGANVRGESGEPKSFLDGRQGLIPDPFVEACADGARPALLLAARGRKRLLAGAGHQVRRERANVVGDVDILGKIGGWPATPWRATCRP